ncbi:cytochrome P450 81E8-like [Durio zibethinus]|uniref:Cytochrome P450 81E8-like n=1 Tax=Durio zibethinus TaxID=66656 RepID=A0A6P5Z5F2_DURZI|nr:cytochrome P450 81E8-like [Durio zibethinus]
MAYSSFHPYYQALAWNKNLPPSPFALPSLGHLHLLKEPLHRCIFTLSQNHGPIFSLQLGSRLAVVVSSPSAVEECFTKNEIISANRPLFWAGKYVGYNYINVGLAPYGDHWRNLRRIFRHEILSPTCLKLSSAIRMDEARILLTKLYNVVSSQDDSFVKVKLKPMLSEFTFNIRIFAGKQYNIGEQVTGKLEGKRLQKLVEDLFQMGVSGNVGDFFPSLQWIDFQGFKKNTVRLFKETDAFLQDLIDEHRMNKGDFERESTMISHLLSLQESQPQYYTDQNIKAQMMDMLNASIDTIMSTVE